MAGIVPLLVRTGPGIMPWAMIAAAALRTWLAASPARKTGARPAVA